MTTIKYTDFIQSGTITNIAAQGSTVVAFTTNFPITPVVQLNYANAESGTLSYSSASTASFTLKSGVAGTIAWTAILTNE